MADPSLPAQSARRATRLYWIRRRRFPGAQATEQQHVRRFPGLLARGRSGQVALPETGRFLVGAGTGQDHGEIVEGGAEKRLNRERLPEQIFGGGRAACRLLDRGQVDEGLREGGIPGDGLAIREGRLP